MSRTAIHPGERLARRANRDWASASPPPSWRGRSRFPSTASPASSTASAASPPTRRCAWDIDWGRILGLDLKICSSFMSCAAPSTRSAKSSRDCRNATACPGPWRRQRQQPSRASALSANAGWRGADRQGPALRARTMRDATLWLPAT